MCRQGNQLLNGLTILALFLFASIVHAQDADTGSGDLDAAERLSRAETVQSSDADIGDSHNLQTGNLSFSQTDVLLAGIGPDIEIVRAFNFQEKMRSASSKASAADWEVAIPSISTYLPTDTNALANWGNSLVEPHAKWQVKGDQPWARCSKFGFPPNLAVSGTSSIASEQWWNGATLSLPNVEDQQILLRSPENTVSPTMLIGGTPATFGLVTNNNWVITCLGTQKNPAESGEGFLAVSPNGTRYWFDWLVFTDPSLYAYPAQTGTKWWRVKGSLLVTRIEDRFGNFVTYEYTGPRLQRIRSSDGRAVDLFWTIYTPGTGVHNRNPGSFGYIDRVVVQPNTPAQRTWTYEYVRLPKPAMYAIDPGWNLLGRLRRVVRPDGSRWTFNLDQFWQACTHMTQTSTTDRCHPTNLGAYPALVGTIETPAGATATFTMDFRASKRYVPNYNPQQWATSDWFAWDLFNPIVGSLMSKTVSSGLSAYTWTYQYSNTTLGVGGNGTPDATTTVVKPDASKTIYLIDNTWRGILEGRVKKTDDYSAGSSSPLRTVNLGYAAANTGPFPLRIGLQIANHIGTERFEKRQPLASQVTQLDATTFQKTIQSYDYFANPVRVVSSSSLGYSRTDDSAYDNNYALWVIGQKQQVTNIETGLREFRAVFDPVSGLPTHTYRFEKLQQILSYDLATVGQKGTIHTAADGNNNVTTFASWKRRIPQTITYADSTVQTSQVDDNGWLSSVTDENGFKTCYTYDAMGRLSSIAYPYEATTGAETCDAVSWNITQLQFDQVLTPENGIPAGHWRKTVSQGNARKLTYYDFLWRPLLVHEYDASAQTTTSRYKRFDYDYESRPTFDSYFESVSNVSTGVRTIYDAIGRTVSISQDSELGPLTSTTQYLAGFKTLSTNPRGQQSQNSYQAYDTPGYELLRRSEQPEGKVVEISRHPQFGDSQEFRQMKSDGSLVQSRFYVYDQYRQLCKKIEPESGATVMGYDGAGNLSHSWSGLSLPDTNSCNSDEAWQSGRLVWRRYTARNRVDALRFSDGRGDQNITYTQDGLPASITTYNDAGNGAPVVNVYSYNKRRLLTGESTAQTGWYAWGIGYGYDANGSLAAQTYPTGLVVNYSPNALGQATAVTSTDGWTYASGVQYYPNGAIKQFTYGNGLTHNMAQNARQLPTRVTDGGNALDHDYGYDPNGNVDHIYDYIIGAPTPQHRYMTYDGLDRLTGTGSAMFGGSDHWHRFTYDALDNIKSWKHAGIKDYAEYVYTNNRLTNIKDSAGATVVGLDYGVQGNLANKNGQTYAFDHGNRLRETTGKEWYRYDGHGRRVLNWRWNEAGVLSQYSQSGQLLYDENYRASGRKATEYVYLAGSVISTRARNIDTNAWTVSFQHTDALGSPVAVTNTAGTVIERTNYEPYGAAINKPAYDGIGYTGHVMDGATGLAYMQQRYFDPTIGRFLSVDPVTANSDTGANFNRYWYANNNPYKFTDPDGRAPNKAGVTNALHIYAQLSTGTLQQLEESHGGNTNRYFYTPKYGWVDVRHFARAARMVAEGNSGSVVRILGFGNEVDQWASEWGDDYRSGFSPEDLPSNEAGIDFGSTIGDGEDDSAFFKWAKKNEVAHNPFDPATGFEQLPDTDPSQKGGKGRGDSNTTSDKPPVEMPVTLPPADTNSTDSEYKSRDNGSR